MNQISKANRPQFSINIHTLRRLPDFSPGFSLLVLSKGKRSSLPNIRVLFGGGSLLLYEESRIDLLGTLLLSRKIDQIQATGS